MANASPFGAWMRKWRKARGLTQVQLAQQAQCAQSMISMYERGVKSEKNKEYSRPEPDLVERLATALKRPVEEARALAGYNPSPVPVTLADIKDAVTAQQELADTGLSVLFNPGGVLLRYHKRRRAVFDGLERVGRIGEKREAACIAKGGSHHLFGGLFRMAHGISSFRLSDDYILP